ncbi:helix-turn-helix domain-containing protein [Magnetovibrio sp. PR-2]|uniref:MerR family transcriptional regulator n=1 Tax=Magnetovibrio sp. PR-2 TaxID=3120356 RepID=UPI002FCE2FAC
MPRDEFTIGHMAKASGCNVQTVRYYESIGILPQPPRSHGNQRLYNQSHVNRAQFVRRSRDLGFSLDQIRALLTLSDDPERPCDEVDALVLDQLKAVDEKITQLQRFRDELQRMSNVCKGGTVANCQIINTLAQTGEHVRPYCGKKNPA